MDEHLSVQISTWQIIIYNLTAMFRLLANDEKREYAGVYSRLRSLSSFTRATMDYLLQPLKAKRAFTYVVSGNKQKYEVLPNGKKNGLSERIMVTGACEFGFYLSDKLIFAHSRHTYIRGKKFVVMDDWKTVDLYPVIFEKNNLRIAIEERGSYIWIVIKGIRFMETSRGSSYIMRVWYHVEGRPDRVVKYKYRQSCIYNLEKNEEFIRLVNSLQTTPAEEFHTRVTEIEKVMGWIPYRD